MIVEQWLRVKALVPNVVVMMRVGDFYEALGSDALTMHEVCGIVLSRRCIRDGEYTPMVGVPYHASEGYVKELLAKGHKVALVEQSVQPDGTISRSEMTMEVRS